MDDKGFDMGLTGKEKEFGSKENLHPYMKEQPTLNGSLCLNVRQPIVAFYPHM